MEQEDKNVAAWQQARTFDDLCELTARFVEGTLPLHSCYGGESVDSETTELVPILAAFNRAGFMTECSQPAVDLDDEGEGQRAFVSGFALEPIAKRIATLGLYTELLVFIVPPGVQHGYQVPVTLGEFHPYTWCGSSIGYEGIECFEYVCNPTAMSALAQAWQVTVIDLKWGRNDYLWENVTRVLTSEANPEKPYSVEPSPDLELDTDFVC
jgi:hypothetical protein